jgi:hypothetical protein
MILLKELRTDYNLCIDNPREYHRKVDSISDLFFLKGEDRLKAEYCPVRIVGKYQITPFVMFGLNPGISKTQSPLEDQEARKSWSHYLNLYHNFYGPCFSHFWIRSPYYTALYHLITGLSNNYFNEDGNKQKPELLDTYLTNIELIPYHSNGLSLSSSRISTRQLDYLTANYKNSLDFIINHNPKLFLFNGNPWHTFLIKHNMIKKYDKVQISTKYNSNLFFFKIEGVPSVLFDKFFQLHYWGTTNYDRRVTIPKIIYEKYQRLDQ